MVSFSTEDIVVYTSIEGVQPSMCSVQFVESNNIVEYVQAAEFGSAEQAR